MEGVIPFPNTTMPKAHIYLNLQKPSVATEIVLFSHAFKPTKNDKANDSTLGLKE